MKVFVFEYLTALGLGCDPGHPMHTMFREGQAMRDALATDFRRLPHIEVDLLDACPESGLESAVAAAAAWAEWTVLIAPEFDGILERLARVAVAGGGRLLGPSVDAIALTADKHALAQHLTAHGIPTPPTQAGTPTSTARFPLVWKPRDGAGSSGMFLLKTPLDIAPALSTHAAEGHASPMILQPYVPGLSASLSFLCGPSGVFPLAGCTQTLSTDGRFTYLGGQSPLPAPLADRAVRIATRAVRTVEGLCGYVGVDLILGEAADGMGDYVIEINPRLTTSYIGLRELARFNIAEKMLIVATGPDPGEFLWRDGSVSFTSQGEVGKEPL